MAIGSLKLALAKRHVIRRLKALFADLESQHYQTVTEGDITHRLPAYAHDIRGALAEYVDVDSVIETAAPIVVSCYNDGISPKATTRRIFATLQL